MVSIHWLYETNLTTTDELPADFWLPPFYIVCQNQSFSDTRRHFENILTEASLSSLFPWSPASPSFSVFLSLSKPLRRRETTSFSYPVLPSPAITYNVWYFPSMSRNVVSFRTRTINKRSVFINRISLILDMWHSIPSRTHLTPRWRKALENRGRQWRSWMLEQVRD